jgi:CheY-like chemotaxis protein
MRNIELSPPVVACAVQGRTIALLAGHRHASAPYIYIRIIRGRGRDFPKRSAGDQRDEARPGVFPTRNRPRTQHHRGVPVSVLIVDDDPAFRALARRLLDDCGLAVVGEADSVAEALSTATELEPSAVLVDVGLPDGDGFTLARQLAALPWRPRVLMTSVDADVEQHDAVRHGESLAFVHKKDLPNAPLRRLLGGE